MFRIGMQIGTGIPHVPPRVKFRAISIHSNHSGKFWPNSSRDVNFGRYWIWLVIIKNKKNKKKKVIFGSSFDDEFDHSLMDDDEEEE